MEPVKHTTPAEERKTTDNLGASLEPVSKKPKFSAPDDSDLLSRLNAFLPEMKAANEGLGAGHNIEDVEEEDETYVEMNLGLGVLEQRKPEGSGSDSDFASNNEEEENGDEDLLGNLLNASNCHGKHPHGKPSIQEVEDSAGTPSPERPRERNKK